MYFYCLFRSIQPTAFLLIGRCLSLATCGIAFLYTVEAYPTFTRALAIATLQMFTKMGGALTPFVADVRPVAAPGGGGGGGWGEVKLRPFHQLRARRALLQIKDVPLKTRRALLPLTLYSNSALLVLRGTSFSCNSAPVMKPPLFPPLSPFCPPPPQLEVLPPAPGPLPLSKSWCRHCVISRSFAMLAFH